MKKLDRPANPSWFRSKNEEGEIVDADLVVNLLETYRFGKANVSAGETRSNVAETAPSDSITERENDEDDDGTQGNKSVHESTSSVSFNSDLIILESTVSETGLIKETGYNWLESSSTNLPNIEKERQQNGEDGEIEEEEYRERLLSESEEKSNLENLLAVQETYELYCPSCSSCITRKVILKKRKLEKHVDLNPNVPVDEPVDEPVNELVDEPVNESVDEPSDIEELEPPVKDDDQEDKEEGDLFTCLACLKYFIWLGVSFLQLDYTRGKPVEEPGFVCDDEAASELDTEIPPSYPATEIHQLNPTAENITMNLTQQKQSKSPEISSENKPEVNLNAVTNINIIQPPPQYKPDGKRFAVELLKSTVYGGLTETITSLGVVSSASASGSSTVNILALAVANMAGGLIVLAQNLQDLINNSDRYEELLGRSDNFRIHILIAVLSYIFFGLIPPLVYAFAFYQTGIKNYKLVSAFSISLICVILLSMIKVYVRKPVNSRESSRTYLKSAAYYTSIIVTSSGISYVVGDIVGEYLRKLGWFSLDQIGFSKPFDETKPNEYRFTSF